MMVPDTAVETDALRVVAQRLSAGRIEANQVPLDRVRVRRGLHGDAGAECCPK